MAISYRARSGSQSMVSASERPPDQKSSMRYHCLPAQRSMRSVAWLRVVKRLLWSLGVFGCQNFVGSLFSTCMAPFLRGGLPSDILHGQACVIDAQVEEPFDTASERFAELICVLLAQKRPAADLLRC